MLAKPTFLPPPHSFIPKSSKKQLVRVCGSDFGFHMIIQKQERKKAHGCFRKVSSLVGVGRKQGNEGRNLGKTALYHSKIIVKS
jgi:hypothetical protein